MSTPRAMSNAIVTQIVPIEVRELREMVTYLRRKELHQYKFRHALYHLIHSFDYVQMAGHLYAKSRPALVSAAMSARSRGDYPGRVHRDYYAVIW